MLQVSLALTKVTLNIMPQMLPLLMHSPAQAPAPQQVAIPLRTATTQHKS